MSKKKIPDTFFETHMMVSEPERWIEPMADANVNLYTFHIEPVLQNVLPICRKIREVGMKVGLALKPGTGIEAIRQYVEHADMILIMTVEPGFGGQVFISDMMPKVQWLRHNYPLLDIEVDGGVGLNTINACAEDDQYDILAISETWLSPHINNNLVNIKGYRLIRKDRVGRAGGVCFHIANTVNFKLVERNDNIEQL
ncbi:hypothetical protein NQ314_015112 [Rhamnusium bicolor]|uniref:ribulose-phosphate 3-epimerase n=1 Tax=Rhamnusium bicolor TaxID=1586634 RepID=A0AAV8X092_9CUCU|nr:hypothetical protein NQ314_015112 [Rhamnusium bicolor]